MVSTGGEGGPTGIYGLEVRGAAKHPTGPGTAPPAPPKGKDLAPEGQASYTHCVTAGKLRPRRAALPPGEFRLGGA